MSERLGIVDYALTLRRWISLYGPISRRELAAWTIDLDRRLRTIPYVKRTRVEPEDDLLGRIAVRCDVSLYPGNSPIAQRDFERIWDEDLAAGLRSVHSILEDQNGFVVHFAAVTPSEAMVSGAVKVRHVRAA